MQRIGVDAIAQAVAVGVLVARIRPELLLLLVREPITVVVEGQARLRAPASAKPVDHLHGPLARAWRSTRVIIRRLRRSALTVTSSRRPRRAQEDHAVLAPPGRKASPAQSQLLSARHLGGRHLGDDGTLGGGRVVRSSELRLTQRRAQPALLGPPQRVERGRACVRSMYSVGCGLALGLGPGCAGHLARRDDELPQL